MQLGRAVGRVALAVAAALAAVAALTAAFLAPPVVHLFLDLSGAAGSLGVTAEEAHRLSDALVADLLVGGHFAVSTEGVPLLDAGERAHLGDVGALVRQVLLAGLLSAVVLLLARRRSGGERVARALADGAALIAGGATLVGLAFAVAFDATFAFAHSLVFADGTWRFDPATSGLVRLYPTPFWIAVALSFCGGLVVIALLARRALRHRGARGPR